MATKFKLKYAVKLKGKSKWVEAENGAWAGSGDAKKGDTVEGVRVWI
jgi:hypothetical protein